MVWNGWIRSRVEARATDSAMTEELRPDGGTVPVLSIDTAFTLLSHHHRRELLLALRDRPSNTASLDELLGELMNGTTAMGPDYHESPESLHVLLRHQHLPRLENAGVVTVDEDESAITYVEHPRLEALLDVVEEWQE